MNSPGPADLWHQTAHHTARFGVEMEDGQSLCALIHGDLGWVLYLREPGDAGFSSRNPAYAGPDNATLDYRLNNGQVDEYPLAWALPVAEVERALDFFRREQKPLPFVTWHNDSGDGTAAGTSTS